MTELLRAASVSVRHGPVLAADNVSLQIRKGPYGRGLVGESGSGKTSIVSALVRLSPTAGGEILFNGQDISKLRGGPLMEFRKAVQVVLQDPNGSLDPRMRAGAAIAEVLKTHRIVPHHLIAEKVEALLTEVGLESVLGARYPHQLSGGQRQRVALARALAVEPDVLILDEPTSALDVTSQARILDLIERLRDERGISYLLVSHNLAIVERLCVDIDVLYLGRIVETGPVAEVLSSPRHPYTAILLSAVPRFDGANPDRMRVLSRGGQPDGADPAIGCPFYSRCPVSIERCTQETPHLSSDQEQGRAACFRVAEIAEDGDLRRTLRLPVSD